MKIDLYLMTFKGYCALKHLIETGKTDLIASVITSADANVANDYYKDIIELCRQNKIGCYDRKDCLKGKGNYSIAISWRWLLPSENLVILHDSLLPKYRGFAPLVTALINKDKEIGVTALLAVSECDKGPIICQKKLSVEYPIKIKNAIERISTLYGEILYDIVMRLESGEPLSSHDQDETKATHTLWLDEDDYSINWEKDSEFIKRFIDSVGFPYKGASTIANANKLRIFDATVIEDVVITNRVPGKTFLVQSGIPTVVCGKGLIRLNDVKFDTDISRSFLPLKSLRIRFK
jgi:methionyl-tRNA formyltransferase